ncbi:uncharacterized protein LOC111609549 [Xiphophorus maculatus]|uniref:uncharacterized protein LOC111609549 n=1 Tax=Xiphophorus maculatus TaxID=8083 RepID=UPI000C6E831E|nr:uncharacterized protein LOC111609549 [Xiphophorus maculatus]
MAPYSPNWSVCIDRHQAHLNLINSSAVCTKGGSCQSFSARVLARNGFSPEKPLQILSASLIEIPLVTPWVLPTGCPSSQTHLLSQITSSPPDSTTGSCTAPLSPPSPSLPVRPPSHSSVFFLDTSRQAPDHLDHLRDKDSEPSSKLSWISYHRTTKSRSLREPVSSLDQTRASTSFTCRLTINQLPYIPLLNCVLHKKPSGFVNLMFKIF